MLHSIIFQKLKYLVLFFVGIFRRALCCFQRRRRNSVPLEHVDVIAHYHSKDSQEENWNWVEHPGEELSEPRTVQDHIELYRKRKIDSQRESLEEEQENRADFFEDMAPKITAQTKLFVNYGGEDKFEANNRLKLVDNVSIDADGELREWEEKSGWEGETLDWDAQEALKEKKRQDREHKMWKQQQKRLEKSNKGGLGARVT